MVARDKLLEQVRRNLRSDWQIGDLKTLAARYGIEWRSPSGSHVIFLPAKGPILSVPARRPIKPVYVRLFVEMIARVQE